MGGAIGDILPSAFGVALSPIPIIAVILMLGTPRARSSGLAFALGWVLGLVIVSVIVVLLAGGSDDPDSGASTAVSVVKLVLGLLFLAMAARQWVGRPKPGAAPTMPAWMAAVDTLSVPGCLGLGVLLSGANPKNLALTLAAAASIAQAGLPAGQATIAIAIFVAIGSIAVAGPVVYYLFAPATAVGSLTSVKQFLSEHNAVIMMVVLLILGAKMLGQGIGGLTG